MTNRLCWDLNLLFMSSSAAAFSPLPSTSLELLKSTLLIRAKFEVDIVPRPIDIGVVQERLLEPVKFLGVINRCFIGVFVVPGVESVDFTRSLSSFLR